MGQTRLIPLTQDKFAIVDEDDFAELSQFKWYVVNHSGNYYAVRKNGRENLYMHRYLMPKAYMVDHADRNSLNNSRNNLRKATYSQNCANKISKEGSSSKYLGVCWYKRGRKWQAQLKHQGKVVYLGRYENEEIAARAYDKAALEAHGEFANLNFPAIGG